MTIHFVIIQKRNKNKTLRQNKLLQLAFKTSKIKKAGFKRIFKSQLKQKKQSERRDLHLDVVRSNN